MFLGSFSVLYSLLALLGTVEAQNPNSPSPTIEPPPGNVVSPSLSLPPPGFSSLSTEPSSTYLGTLTSLPASSETLPASGFSQIGNVLKPTITSYTFTPFPAPLENPIPEVFPETYPDNPPPPGDSVIPDFGPAWAAAYGKAKAMVGRFLMPPLLLPFQHSRLWTGSGFDARGKS